jgi:hypothetical protein
MLGRRRGLAVMLIAAGVLCLATGPVLAAGDGAQGPSVAVFFWQIIALLLCGRLLGEAMQRIGQPAVLGQLIAGILLGPSVLGALWPQLQHALFPPSPEQKAMTDAVAQLVFCCYCCSPAWKRIFRCSGVRGKPRSAYRSQG